MVACFKRAMDQGMPGPGRPVPGPPHPGGAGPDLHRQHRDAHARREAGLPARGGQGPRAALRRLLPQLRRGLLAAARTTAGKGLVDRLVAEFPRFNDVSPYHGHEVKLYKLAQLGYWALYAGLKRAGGFRIDDIGSMTAFADYIVPVALRVMDILVYTPELEEKIRTHQLIPRDSEEEVEIRAHMLYAERAADRGRQRAAPAGAAGDHPAGGRAALAELPRDALAPSPDPHHHVLT